MCPREEELSAYLDKETTLIATADIAAHLQECDSCRRKLELMQGLSFAMRRDLLSPGLISSSRADIRRRLDHLDIPGRKERSLWSMQLTLPLPLAAAALLAILALAAFPFIRNSVSPRQDAFSALAQQEYVQEMNTLVADKEGLPQNGASLQELLRILESEGASVEVRIELPKMSNFSVQGEPQLLRAADFAGGGER